MYIREEETNLQCSKLGPWSMGDSCCNWASHLEGEHATGTWDERVKRSYMGILGLTFFECSRLGVLVSAEATISVSATDTLKTGNDGRCCGPPPGRHLP